MNDQSAAIATFLARAGWNGADRFPLAGDMSSRKYERLLYKGNSAILMISDFTVSPFCNVTNWLKDAGFSAPEIIAQDLDHNLLLLEDFGDVSVKSLLAKSPGVTDRMFELCINLLLNLRSTTPLDTAKPSASQLVESTELADAYYPGIAREKLTGFRNVLETQIHTALSEKTCVSLRDFHTENLMWLPDRTGIRKLGLLDYQDAIQTHPCYDLVSLLTDARTEITRAQREATLDCYITQGSESPAKFRAHFAAFSAQRNLRILGIFCRGKRHLDCLPRVHRYFFEALEHPIFSTVIKDVKEAIPPPFKATT